MTTAPTNYWNAVACSADGMTILAVAGATSPSKAGPVYTSFDGGTTWVSNSVLNTNWSAAASSADGTKFIIAANGGMIYTSTNSGTDWLQSTNAPAPNHWNALACSADGTHVVATTEGQAIFTSSNSGVTWVSNVVTVPLVRTQDFNCVASSADGTTLLANGSFGLYSSTNSGATWFTNNTPPLLWQGVTMSADGDTLVAVTRGNIYISTNGGAAWHASSAPALPWQSVASSADGRKLAVASEVAGAIYTSNDSGVTWVSNVVSIPSWHWIASSADGNRLIAVVGYPPGPIYTSYSTPVPMLTVENVGTDLVLHWTVPATDFILQETTDLNGATWTVSTNSVALNLTTLQDEAHVAPETDSKFFRLATPQ